MLIKVGDYVEACRLLPGILIEMSVKEIDLDLQEIDTEDEGARLIDCKIFYEDYSRQSDMYIGSDCSLKSCGVHSISGERYYYLNQIGDETLKKLWNYWKKCDAYSWEMFTELYYYNPIKVMEYIPIEKVLNKNLVEFRDGSSWKCVKQKHFSRSPRGGIRKTKHHYYIPKQLIKC